jgi:hypothetical protein
LIEALRHPRAYPHEVDGVEHIETHISHVLLAGEYAYKFKKPLDLGFLDFRPWSGAGSVARRNCGSTAVWPPISIWASSRSTARSMRRASTARGRSWNTVSGCAAFRSRPCSTASR